MFHHTRQTTRRDRGAVLPIVALSLAFLMAAVAFGVDHGRITTNRRTLQKVADVVALDAVLAINGGTAAEIRDDVEARVLDSAVRNEYLDPGSYTFVDGHLSLPGDKGIDYVLGTYDTTTETLTPALDNDRPNAVRVSLSDGFSYYFQPGNSTSTMLSTAMLLLPTDDDQCDGPCMAEGFNIGSFVAGMTTSTDSLPDLPGLLPPAAQSAVERRATLAKTILMNAIYGRALGRVDDAPTIDDPTSEELPDTQLGIDLVGYQGLANTTVTLDELRAVLGFGSVTELLDAQLSMQDFLQGLIDALQLPDPADQIPDVPYTAGLPGTTIPASGVPQVDGRVDYADSRIDGVLDQIKDRAPSGSDLSPFDDPSATFLQPHADANTTAAAISALGQMKAVTLPAKTLPPNQTLRDFIQVRQGYETTAADARMSVLDLVGQAALITGGNFFATDVLIPVSSPDAPSLGLPTLLSNRITALESRYGGDPSLIQAYEDLQSAWPSSTELVRGRLEVSVIDPPKIGFGSPRSPEAFAETAQINASLSLDLVDVDLSPLTDAGLVPSSLITSTLADMKLPIVITGGRASAALTSMDCADLEGGLPSVYDVNTDAFELYVGEAVDLTEADPTIQDAAMVESSSSLLDITIDGSAAITLQGVSDSNFGVTGAYNSYNTYRVANDPTSDLEQALMNNLDPLIPQLDTLLSPLGNTVIVNKANQALKLSQIITNRVPDLDYNAFRPLTSALGVGIGGADLTADFAQCGLRVLVED